MPGFPVLHYLLKFAQTHVHWLGDAIQPSHCLLPPSPAFILSQHQVLFQWVGSSLQVAEEEKYWSFSISPSNEYSGLIAFKIDNNKGTCHLPLWRLNPVLLQLLTFNTLWRSSGWDEAFCAPGNLVGQVFRYFQELISWSQSLHYFKSRKSLNPLLVTSAPCDRQQNFCKVSPWLHWAPPSLKSYILTFPDFLFGAVSQSYLRCCLLGCGPHFTPNKTYLTNLNLSIFLVDSGIIFLSEAVNVSPNNLDSSLCFLQPGIVYNVLCIQAK